MPDVRKAKSSKYGICNGMGQYVCIRVTLKAMRMRDRNAAENQGSIRSKLMDVISNDCLLYTSDAADE